MIGNLPIPGTVIDIGGVRLQNLNDRLPSKMKRLVVLVPDQDVNEAQFARRIWTLVGGKPVGILFITLVANKGCEAQAHRRLITLCALSADNSYQIESRVIKGKDWLTALKTIFQEGDLFVCHQGQTEIAAKGERKPLSELISSGMRSPVFMLTGLYESITPRKSNYLAQAAHWATLAVILAIFFVFEVSIDRASVGWVNHFFFMLVFIFEGVLIWIWNSIKV